MRYGGRRARTADREGAAWATTPRPGRSSAAVAGEQQVSLGLLWMMVVMGGATETVVATILVWAGRHSVRCMRRETPGISGFAGVRYTGYGVARHAVALAAVPGTNRHGGDPSLVSRPCGSSTSPPLHASLSLYDLLRTLHDLVLFHFSSASIILFVFSKSSQASLKTAYRDQYPLLLLVCQLHRHPSDITANPPLQSSGTPFYLFLSFRYLLPSLTRCCRSPPHQIFRMSAMDSWRVAVLGDGGVGKTALAVQVYFLPAISLFTYSRSLSRLSLLSIVLSVSHTQPLSLLTRLGSPSSRTPFAEVRFSLDHIMQHTHSRY